MKYYVVFQGFNPGVYDNWDDAREQVEGFSNARVKSYPTAEEAAFAYRAAENPGDSADMRNFLRSASHQLSAMAEEPAPDLQTPHSWPPEVDANAWAVDAACAGNPGLMEYRGVDLATGKELFRIGPFEQGTNNIGEFLAIVHAMALMTRDNNFHNIYSDSNTGMAWVRKKRPNTRLEPTEKNRKVFELMARATHWLQTHGFPGKVMKWEKEKWGEIPADFGRK